MSAGRRGWFWIDAGLIVSFLLTFYGAFGPPTDWPAIPSHFFQFVLRHVSTFDAGDVNFFSQIATFVVYCIPFAFIDGLLERLFRRRDEGGGTSTEMLIRRFGRRK